MKPLMLLLAMLFSHAVVANDDLRLWYTQPAAGKWEDEALPIGNG